MMLLHMLRISDLFPEPFAFVFSAAGIINRSPQQQCISSVPTILIFSVFDVKPITGGRESTGHGHLTRPLCSSILIMFCF